MWRGRTNALYFCLTWTKQTGNLGSGDLPRILRTDNNVVTSIPSLGFWIVTVGTTVYNIGGFGTGTGTLAQTIIIPEDGIYYIEGQAAFAAGSMIDIAGKLHIDAQGGIASTNTNGTGVDITLINTITMFRSPNINSIITASTITPLHAGDQIDWALFQSGSSAINTVAGYGSLKIIELGKATSPYTVPTP